MIDCLEWIGPYEASTPACRDYDPRAANAARQVATLIQSRLPSVDVEHVGSTSVPGCAGKWTIDLILVYPKGLLAEACDVLESLGFQRQTGRDPFPEDRPMRVGSLLHDGIQFLLHVHVLSASSHEVAELLEFRERLRADSVLTAEYVAAKRAILAGGCSDSVEYSIRKGAFIKNVLAD
jgi:GrpB-like predicted nucleotidyltransferase (UPF0157 family)